MQEDNIARAERRDGAPMTLREMIPSQAEELCPGQFLPELVLWLGCVQGAADQARDDQVGGGEQQEASQYRYHAMV